MSARATGITSRLTLGCREDCFGSRCLGLRSNNPATTFSSLRTENSQRLVLSQRCSHAAATSGATISCPPWVPKHRRCGLGAKLAGHLPQPLRLDPRILTQLLANPVLERIQLRPRRRPGVLRRRLAAHRLRHRVPRQPQPQRDLLLRTALDQHQPSDLSHCCTPTTRSPSPIHSWIQRGSRPDRTTPGPRQHGLLFNRRRWPSIHPAPIAFPSAAWAALARLAEMRNTIVNPFAMVTVRSGGRTAGRSRLLYMPG